MFIPDYVKKVTDAIEEAGEKAYPVGGCVRDGIMGKTPDDYDIAVSCPPQKTEELLHGFRIIETGIKHGTVTAVSDGHNIEITTFRVDGAYRDNRHPEGVVFTDDIIADLSRRDFTVNAIAYSVSDGYIDPFGGQADIRNGVIRCVGEPDRRFTEDALRIVRGMRFASALGFTVEKNTAESMIKNRSLLKNIAGERIFAELKKLLVGKNAADVLTRFADIVSTLFPETAAMSDGEMRRHIGSVRGASCPETAFAALFFGVESEKTAAVLERLKTDGAFRDTVLLLGASCREYDSRSACLCGGEKGKTAYFRIFCGKYGERMTLLLTELLRLMRGCSDAAAEKFIADGCVGSISPKNLRVDGRDLSKLGFKGERIGSALDFLVTLVALGEVPNEKNALILRLNECRD